MRRRDFLRLTSGAVAAGSPLLALAQATPCPPPAIGVAGGTTVSTSCGSGDAQADWLLRTGQDPRYPQPGVVWYHGFESDAEVDQFRWVGGYGGGNDPGALTADAARMYRVATGGPHGPYMEIYHPGTSAAPNVNWWRPFSAFASPGNGRKSSDPGGGKPVRTWAPTQGGGQTSNWYEDFYGPSTYQQEFYLQVRAWRDPRRSSAAYSTAASGAHSGKHSYITTTIRSLTAQEIVTFSGNGQGNTKLDFFRVYVSGSPPIEDVAYPSSVSGQQYGSELSNYPTDYCDVGTNPGKCWQWSDTGWDTILYCVTPGSFTSSGQSRFRVWACRSDAAVKTYTKIYDIYWNHSWESSSQRGWNAFCLNSYQNGIAFPGPFFQRYAQIIFSTKMIPCPQV